jgi:hypothetical protein
MNKNDLEFRKRWLQWALDFIQMDLNSLSKMKRKKLAKEIVYFCGDDLFTLDWEDFEYNASFPTEERGDLLNKYLEDMETDPTEVQEALRNLINIILKMSSRSDKESDKEPNLWELPDIHSILFIGWHGGEPNIFERGIFNIFSRPKEGSFLNWGMLNLAKLVDQLEAHSIKKCKGCGRYFLNVTRKKKIYCNFSCASRSIAHKRYEELRKHPKKYEAHLKKYRKYSSKRYEMLRKIQYGPNVKIQKRNNRKED